mmetsp:Transcript_41254/g.47527  ORF Transcript_41254/g.47527 Transcript_41254/m.47527 type:complete len:173 (-) Transcript_41254:9-527(-)
MIANVGFPVVVIYECVSAKQILGGNPKAQAIISKFYEQVLSTDKMGASEALIHTASSHADLLRNEESKKSGLDYEAYRSRNDLKKESRKMSKSRKDSEEYSDSQLNENEYKPKRSPSPKSPRKSLLQNKNKNSEEQPSTFSDSYSERRIQISESPIRNNPPIKKTKACCFFF